MGKMILISDDDLKSLVSEAVTNAVDSITKKIASRAAVMSYNNQIFSPSRTRVVESCGSSGGGCGSTYEDDDDWYGYSCGNPSGGGCGGSSHYDSGGCGGGYSSGGC